MAKTVENPAARRWRLGFWVVVCAYGAGLLAYAQTKAFTWDEAYHLLAAQLILNGRRPYLDFCFPQTPLNAYWNAGLMAVFGQSWRVPHAAASLLTLGAVLLMADYVARRFPIREWAWPAALATFLTAALNAQLFAYAPLGQPYAMCLFALALAFRLAVRAPHGALAATAGAGLCAGIAAGSSLLTAIAAPVLLGWILWHSPAGARWRKAAAFVAAAALPFAPVAWLAWQGPRQAWFNLIQYHVDFRKLYWTDATRHDFEVLTSWINSGQALATGALALAGLWFAARASDWTRQWRSETWLCAWLAAAIAAEVGRAHPTFPQYFLLTTPFLAVLAGTGVYAIGSRAIGARARLWTVGLTAAVLLCGLGRYLYDERAVSSWAGYERLAAKVDAVTPSGAPLLAEEPIYFLTRRIPPPGFELYYTHKIQLPLEDRRLLHLVTEDEAKAMARAGDFATVYTCNEDLVDAWELNRVYRKSATLEDCFVFWDRKTGN